MLIESLEGRRVLTSGVPFESFDSVFDPALPAGWVSTNPGAWTTVAGGSHTANIHAFIPNPSIASSGVLSSVPFTPTAQSSIVNFAHFYNTEATYDGGILEIAIPGVNNGLFQEITAAGGTFITGGYNSTINPSASATVLAGRQAWSGNSGGYVATSVQLPLIAIGQNVQLAWSFASDSSVPGVGWRVDSISLSGPIAPIDLASLTPSQGRTIFGAGANDESGKSVSIVGDVNGDGYDDMLIGAPNAEIPPGFTLPQGASYLVFGSPTPLATIDLFEEGIVIFDSTSTSGRTAAPAGDVNGDGLADFFIGDDRQNANTGASFVVFGKTDWSANTGNIGLNLNSLGTAGIKFTGVDLGDQSGFSVSSAGDVNGDGFDDLLVGARSANSVTNGRTLAGESYLIFGKSDWTANQIVNLATVGQVAGPAGVTFFGSDSDDRSGISVSGIGDVNGDGFDDLAIGAFLGDGTTTSVRSDSGETAILFGKSNWTGITSIDLATLGSNNGLTIFGVEAGDYSGISVSRVGDLNGDGFDDIAIGAYSADGENNGKALAGDSYIVFGAANLFGRSSINLATLGQPDQPTGITIFGADVGDRSGYSISGGGDLNGDGFDDLVIGAKQGDGLLNLKTAAGDTYVVFGGPSLPPTIDLATLGANALAIFGANGSDQSGTSVSLGGDVNGDGFDDLLIGANFAASLNNVRSNAGESYLIFGGNGFTNSIPTGNIGTSGDNTIDGTFGAEILVGGDGNDTLQAFTGGDVLLGGRGDDVIAFNAGLTPDFKRIVGGNGVDTLLLAGNPNFLDLTRIPDNRLVDIEVIDMMTGAGNNTLVLNEREVLNISSTTNTLTVIAAPSKRVFFESGWTKQADNAGFQVFTKGAATLRVSVGAPVLVNVIDLADLGSAGSTINGAAADDFSGRSVSSAGDVNGDGYDDFIIGASFADLNGQPNTDNRGKSYVLFGGPSLPATINLSDNLGASIGFTILGQAADDRSGYSVSSAGDVNGDGFDDLIVGAILADPGTPARNNAGKSYVIFGKSDWSTTPAITLSDTLSMMNPGVTGITILGQAALDRSGASVSGAGDVNGDGFDDLIVGARYADPASLTPANNNGGKSYVIFGGPSLPAAITLSDTLSTTNLGVGGFTILGQAAGDFSGFSVSSAGDINGDGFDDLIVGARYADPASLTLANNNGGKSYVIFGGPSLPDTIILSDTLSTTNLGVGGFTILGQAANDQSGRSVSSAGDVNGDGFDDLIVGAFNADPANLAANSGAGKSYVIFGGSSLPATITLSDTLSMTNPGVGGFTILGQAASDFSGFSVSGAGDVNGDGFDDLIVGALDADPGIPARNRTGKSYVIFGGLSLPATITLSDTLSATNPGVGGFTILGQAEFDDSGASVSSAGDVNGDGFDDLIIGANRADPANAGPGSNNAGKSYILYGGNGFTSSILPGNLGTSGVNTFTGTSAADILNGADGDDILVGQGGADVLLGGRGNDTLAISDLTFRRIVGGNGLGINNENDTLRLDGSGLALNLLNIADNRILDIETINITGSGNNSLTVTQREVLNLSSSTNTLTVIGNAGDQVGFEPGWTKGADSGGFQVFTKGAATLRVSVGVPVSVTLIELGNFGSAGSTINGAAAGDLSGRSVSNAGDVNGDGYDDFIIGADRADLNGHPNTDNRGKSYVLFGGPSLPATINLLDNLGASVGFTILGQAVGDYSGFSVSNAGDVNGDGFDDLIVGAPSSIVSAGSKAGNSYVVFGKSDWSGTPTIDLNSNTLGQPGGPAGFTIVGQAAGDYSGRSVSSAGDVNGDGFDDLIVGAIYADPATAGPGDNTAGKSYVIFGGSSLPATITLSDTLSTTNPGVGGFTILGQAVNDQSGGSVSSAGDVNGDGFDDLIIGARSADPALLTPVNNNGGKSYVILGGSSLPATITLSDTLTTTNPGVGGFIILGQVANDRSGRSVSSAGDINGDGFDDLIVGANGADPGTLNLADNNAGKSYVIFGKSDWSTTPTITLSDTLSTTNPGVGGFTILGQAAGDQSGVSVSGAGDVNGDGFDDLIVGAVYADPGTPARDRAGKSYVIFGGLSLPATITLSDNLSATNPGVTGFTILGQAALDGSGFSVSGAGDVNGDGFDDLVVGTRSAAPANAGPGNDLAGKSYILYGGNGFTNSIPLTNLGGAGPDSGVATPGGEIVNGADGDDDIAGFGGADVLIGGRGNDILGVSDLSFKRIVGGNGNDTLRLDASGLALNLLNIADNRIVDIETINITGSGNNALTVTQREVLNLSSSTNTLTVIGNAGDQVGFEPGWTKGADSGGFQVFTKGAATLRVSIGVPVSVTLIELGNLGSAGSIINGAAAVDFSGRSVSNAGDVNGDGYDDFIIGAAGADLSGQPNTDNRGKSYVLFGGPSLPATITLSDNLGTTNPGVGGFTILGEAAADRSGDNVSSAGDVNGDGFDDLIVAARYADPGTPARDRAGKSYVIFGKADWSTTPTITLSDTLSTTNPGVGGFTILGQAANDRSGISVSSAGDVNGDGFDDLIVGAYRAAPGIPARIEAGKSYVIFGGSSLPATMTLSDTLSTTNPGVGGFTILGQAAGDLSGFSVSGAGDVNGDGFDDLIVGAFTADPGTPARINAGKSYVIFGGSSLPATMTLSDTLSTTNPGVGGFTILGQAADDRSGYSVSSAGDVNGDGFDDLIVGANRADPATLTPADNQAGKSYVIFGGSSLPATITLSDNLSATNPGVGGFTILGQATSDESGISVSSAGDINGDGFDDLIVGALFADPGTPVRTNASKSYVIFGGVSLPTTITLSDSLSATNPGLTGFTIVGQAAYDSSGRSVSSAGDVNGDGFDDLIVGAFTADPANAGPGNNLAGKSYILYGGNGFTNSILPANIGTSGANTINGNAVANILNGADGDDILVGLGGADVLLGGRGNDTLAISDLTFRRIVGGNGNDTLRLDGTGITLDLTTIRDNRIVDIEEINITGSGNNTLNLTQREVLNLSSASNTLIVRRNSGDIVNRGAGWTQLANETISNIPFEVFTQGAATLKIQASLPPVVTLPTAAATYVENAAPLSIFTGTTVTDVDTPTFTGGTLTITNTNGQVTDRLTFAPNAFFTLSGNSILVAGQVFSTFVGGSGTTPLVFTFTNQAFLNRVVALFGSIQFSNISDSPSSVSRILSVRLTDGSGGASALVNRTVAVTPVADAPVVTVPTSAATYVENAAPLSIFTGTTVTDVDTPTFTGGVLTITNTNGQATDRLTFAPNAFFTLSGNSILVAGQVFSTFVGGSGTTPLVFTFTNQAFLNRVVALFGSIRFSNISDAPSGVSRILSVRLTDGAGGTSALVNRTVAVTPVADAPVVTVPTSAATYVENAAPLSIFAGTTVTDVDTPTFTGGVLTITNTNGQATDRLTFAPNAFFTLSGNSILVAGQVFSTFVGGSGTSPLVFTFTNQAFLNRVVALFGSIRFSNISDAPSGVSRILSVRLTDGAGGSSAIVNRTVAVTPVADAPVVTLPTAAATYVENAAPLSIFTGTTVTDVDTPTFTGGVLTITNTNGQATDRLTFAPNAFFTLSGNSILVAGQVFSTFVGGSGTTPLVFTFTNQALLNRVVALFGSIQFSSVSDSPSGVSRILSVRLTDGAGGSSAIVNRTVGVAPVNDAPVVGGISGSASYVRNAAPIVVADSATVSDADGSGFGGGTLSVSTILGGSAVNRIELGGSYSINGSNQVLLGVEVIGTVTSNGVGLNALSITFGNTATLADVQGLLRNVRFRTVGATLASSVTLGVTVFDPSNVSSGLTSKIINVT